MIYKIIAVITLALTCFSCSSRSENEEGTSSPKEALQKIAKDADKLTVLVPFIGGKDLRGREGKLVALIKGQQNIQEFISLIEFKAEDGQPGCNCEGSYLLKFSKQGKGLVSLGYHHVSALRWSGGAWKGDRALTDTSLKSIIKWFKKNGFKEPALKYEQALADERKRRERFAIILKYFDQERQDILKHLNILKHPSDPDVLSNEDVSIQLYESYDDKTELLDVVFKIFGAKESARGYDYFEQILIKAVAFIDEKSYLQYLDKKQEMTNEEKMGMSCFLFFQYKLTKRLYQEHPEKISKLVEFWIEHEIDYELGVIGMNTILELNIPELNKIYEPYIQGVKKLNLRRNRRSLAPVIDIRCLMLLKRAEFGDKAVLIYCNEMLQKQSNTLLEQSVIKISKALLDGDVSEISPKDFEHRVSFLSKSRRLLAERYPSLKSYDILMAGTKHFYSDVRAKSLRAIKKLLGENWNQGEESKLTESQGEDVRKWWTEHRETYKFPQK